MVRVWMRVSVQTQHSASVLGSVMLGYAKTPVQTLAVVKTKSAAMTVSAQQQANVQRTLTVQQVSVPMAHAPTPLIAQTQPNV